MTRWPAVPVVALLLLVVTGCARPSFTIEDYALAFARYSDCMTQGGTPLIERDLTGPVYDYSVPMAAIYLGTADFCYADFRLVDEAWRAETTR
jgi:hypothetical protein